MVCGRRQCTNAVEACRQTASNGSCQSTFAIASIIDTFEKGKLASIWCLRRAEVVAEGLNGDLWIVSI